MTIPVLLKDIAQKIITFASDKERGSKTWDEQPSAPEGGFADRAGFTLLDDVECYADVALIEQDEAVIRARIAKVTEGESGERFSIITLDFSADKNSVKKAIEDHLNISKQVLTDILGQEQTVPKLIHVSYNTGRDSDGKLIGIRYEYSKDQVMSLKKEEKDKFAKTLMLTFDNIMGDRKLS